MLKDLLIKNRSYRRFYEEERMERAELEEIVGWVSYCPSARNAQPLKYLVITDREECDLIFPALSWAGYLKDWSGPDKGERPSAYLVQLLDTRISKDPLCDDGIQAQTLMLAATEKGYGGCIIKAVAVPQVKKDFHLPDYMEVRLVLALGKPREKVVLEPMPENGDYKYWRDEKGGHHVPKRSVAELIWKRG